MSTAMTDSKEGIISVNPLDTDLTSSCMNKHESNTYDNRDADRISSHTDQNQAASQLKQMQQAVS